MRIPLFPLQTVLFPGCPLDLQIFEPRYLDMISRCMRQEQSFGVVCLLEGREVGAAATRLATVGCEAVIRDFEHLPNKLLGLRVEGGRRFALGETEVQADQLILGQVNWLEEDAAAAIHDEHDDLVVLLQALVHHPAIADLPFLSAQNQAQLGYQLAYLLPLSRDEKLHLLELDDAVRRLELIEDMVAAMQEDL